MTDQEATPEPTLEIEQPLMRWTPDLETAMARIGELKAELERLLEVERAAKDAEAGLAAQMYRERLSDLNAESGDWPRGVTANLGELDFEAEKLVRKAWASIPRERQIELERIVEAALRRLVGA